MTSVANASPQLTGESIQMTLQQPKPKPPKHRDTSLPARKVEGQEQASSATRSRKRQINSDDDNEPELKRARLTRKNLFCSTRWGGRRVLRRRRRPPRNPRTGRRQPRPLRRRHLVSPSRPTKMAYSIASASNRLRTSMTDASRSPDSG